MPETCSKCIDILRLQKIQLDIINDIKLKNVSIHHEFLKSEICRMLRILAKETVSDEFSTSIKTEFTVEGIGRIDVVAFIGGATIAVECGDTSLEKILKLQKHFDVVLHVPFCYTSDFWKLDTEKIVHQLSVSIIGKDLEKRGREGKFERNKVMCLEKGICSLPSGRDGYPKEAYERLEKS